MICEEAREALSALSVFSETSDGCRVSTHCLYPSFETVYVYVVRKGDGFRVHDSAGAYHAAWAHGRDEHTITRVLNSESAKFHLAVSENSIFLDVTDRDWLSNAILSVANASASAASAVVSKAVISAEHALVDRIRSTLCETFGVSGFRKEVDIKGKSGGTRHFDFSVPTLAGEDLLINGVAPHHASISFKYVAFADVEADQSHKFAVFDKSLNTDDTALLQQVASILSLKSLSSGALRAVEASR